MVAIETDILWPVIPALIGVIAALYGVARKAWKNEAMLFDLHKEICGSRDRPELGLMDRFTVLTDRVNKLEVQFGPFLKIIEDSLARLMVGAVKGNPIDPIVLRKIKLGLATVKEIDAFDAALVKDIETNGVDALALVVVRYWVALKKAEAQGVVRE